MLDTLVLVDVVVVERAMIFELVFGMEKMLNKTKEKILLKQNESLLCRIKIEQE